MFRWLKTKFFVTLGFTHFAFFVSLWGLYKLHTVHGGVAGHAAHMDYFPWLFAGAFLTYGSVVGGLVWMYMPFAPWARRMSSWRAFRHWVVEELPAIIAVASSLAALWPIVWAAWRELKSAHDSGKLDYKRFSNVARKFAEKAEHFGEHRSSNSSGDEHHGEKPHANGNSKRVA